MGIIKQGQDVFTAAYVDWVNAQSTPPNRRQRRKFVASLVNAGNEWLAKFDAQENAAPVSFAASRLAQFNTFVDALPPVTLEPAPVNDPVEP
jgi:hypothetical protein